MSNTKSKFGRWGLALAVVALAATLIVPGTASGARKGAKKADSARRTIRLDLIDKALVDLPWDRSLAEVLKWCSTRLDEYYGPKIKAALDVRGRTNLHHKKQDEMRVLRDAVVPFDGRRTGYEVSIVAGEFVAGAEESLLVLRVGSLHHYLFFTYGKLWKYARPVKTTETFALLAERLAAEQGDPTTVKRRGGAAGIPESLYWGGDQVNLRVIDKRLLYGADLFVIEDHGIASRIGELRGGKQPAADDTALDPDLEGFLDDGE